MLQPLLLSGAVVPELPVVNGSYWFVPVYCVALILSELILKYYPKVVYIFLGLTFVYYVFLWFGIRCPEGYVFGQSIQMILFYVSLVLLGTKFYMVNIRRSVLCIVFLILSALFAYLVIQIWVKLEVG